jgi:hypothetical protein
MGLRSAAAALLLLAGPALGDELQLLDRSEFSMRIDEPENGSKLLGPTSLIEVAGWAGAYSVERSGLLDIAVIIDTSWSARHGSGADVNGDGHAGGVGFRFRRSFAGWLFGLGLRNSDPDDSILRAEVAAVRGLRESLADPRNRVGIVMMRDFGGIGTRLDDPPERLERTLSNLERAKPEGRTNFMDAIRIANTILMEAPDDGLTRSKIIILLSDGQPTVPPGNEYATDQAIVAAQESAELGIRIYTIGLGLGDDSRAFYEAARITGGKFLALEKPGDVILALSEIRFTGLEDVTIENTTTGKPARMMRVFQNGTFDGFIKLKQGSNRIRIHATSVEGKELVEERVVIWKLKWPHDRNARWKAKRDIEVVQEKLRDRQAESELVDEMNEMRERLARELEVDVEPKRAGGERSPPQRAGGERSPD